MTDEYYNLLVDECDRARGQSLEAALAGQETESEIVIDEKEWRRNW